MQNLKQNWMVYLVCGVIVIVLGAIVLIALNTKNKVSPASSVSSSSTVSTVEYSSSITSSSNSTVSSSSSSQKSINEFGYVYKRQDSYVFNNPKYDIMYAKSLNAAPVRILRDGYVTQVALSPLGDKIAWGRSDKNVLTVYDAISAKTTEMEVPFDIWQVGWSPDGKHVTVHDSETRMLIMNIDSGKSVASLGTSKFTIVKWVNPTRLVFAAGHLPQRAAEGPVLKSLVLYDLTTKKSRLLTPNTPAVSAGILLESYHSVKSFLEVEDYKMTYMRGDMVDLDDYFNYRISYWQMDLKTFKQTQLSKAPVDLKEVARPFLPQNLRNYNLVRISRHPVLSEWHLMEAWKCEPEEAGPMDCVETHFYVFDETDVRGTLKKLQPSGVIYSPRW